MFKFVFFAFLFVSFDYLLYYLFIWRRTSLGLEKWVKWVLSSGFSWWVIWARSPGAIVLSVVFRFFLFCSLFFFSCVSLVFPCALSLVLLGPFLFLFCFGFPFRGGTSVVGYQVTLFGLPGFRFSSALIRPCDLVHTLLFFTSVVTYFILVYN